EEKGYTYPAAIISDTLRAADITHISNEVPFLSDCQVNASPNNLVMCSSTNYWASLEAVGTDIVGLSGNHVNDFGRSGARESIGWYRAHNIPIYGSGMNVQEACAPLLWYHNGTRFAFLAALAFGPEFAWATADQPGACYYYDHKEEVLAAVRQLAQQVDVVAIELQYEETYNPYPTSRQVQEFRELREAGATLVTGVQSHVPQSLEPYGADDAGGAGMIVYGLGNLFFDQMQSWNTRTELYIRHTFYDGRLISTEILTGVLEDFAQPRWATAEERAGILSEIFAAAPSRPRAVANTGQ
ncbi:MAG: CapA family protein, partial [Caldilineaceae bacterium]|nr:CapA family protein [Caldilineaceae bacterium]